MNRPEAPSVYEAVGGLAFFVELVDRFYDGVATDDVLLPLYPEPDDLTDAAMAYMRAVDLALDQSFPADWEGKLGANGVVLRVFVSGHDYGPLFERGGVLARFPELELVVETEEL